MTNDKQLQLIETDDPDSTEAVALANEILAKNVNAIGSTIGEDTEGDAFSWNNDDDAIVIYEQPETAVYFNKMGAMVIRQRGWPEDDSFVFIQPAFVTQFLEDCARKWREQK